MDDIWVAIATIPIELCIERRHLLDRPYFTKGSGSKVGQFWFDASSFLGVVMEAERKLKKAGILNDAVFEVRTFDLCEFHVLGKPGLNPHPIDYKEELIFEGEFGNPYERAIVTIYKISFDPEDIHPVYIQWGGSSREAVEAEREQCGFVTYEDGEFRFAFLPKWELPFGQHWNTEKDVEEVVDRWLCDVPEENWE